MDHNGSVRGSIFLIYLEGKGVFIDNMAVIFYCWRAVGKQKTG